MPNSPELIAYVVGLFVVAAIGVLTYLIKKAFTDLTDGVKVIGGKIENVKDMIAGQNTMIALLTHRVDQLEKTLPWNQQVRP